MRVSDASPGDLLLASVTDPFDRSDRRRSWQRFVGRWAFTADDRASRTVHLPSDAPDWLVEYRGDAGSAMSFSAGEWVLPSAAGTYVVTFEVSGPLHGSPASRSLRVWPSARSLSPVDCDQVVASARSAHARRLRELLASTHGVRVVCFEDVELDFVGRWEEPAPSRSGGDLIVAGEQFDVESADGDTWRLRGVSSGSVRTVDVLNVAADPYDFFLREHRRATVSSATAAPRAALRSALAALDPSVDPRKVAVSADGVFMPWPTVQALLSSPEAHNAINSLMEASLFVSDATTEASRPTR